MNVLLHADGSTVLGAGHQVRAAALAFALVRAGHTGQLVARDLPGSPHGWAWRGLAHSTIPPDAVAEALVERAREVRADALVVDDPAASPEHLRALARVAPVVVIDDVPGRDLSAASAVVNPWPGVRASDYGHVREAALGLAYALVRPEFAGPRGVTAGGPTLVVMGGNDARGVLPQALQALLEATPRRMVVATGAEVGDSLRALIEQAAGRVLVRGPLDAAALVQLMRSCNDAVLSASTVAVEAACLGLPFVAVELSADQARLAAGLRDAHVPTVTPATLGDLPDALERARAPVDFVDGKGPDRVVALLERLAASRRSGSAPVMLRPVSIVDEHLLRGWRNQPEVQAGMYTDHEIGREEHARWLRAVLADPSRAHWVVVHQGEDAGVANLAQIDRTHGRASFGIYLARPSARGVGAGATALDLLLREAFDARGLRRLSCEALATNLPAIRLYERAGFRHEGILREHVVKGGRPVDVVTMAMLRDEWLARRGELQLEQADSGEQERA